MYRRLHAASILCLLAAAALVGCDPFGTQFEKYEPALTYKSGEISCSTRACRAQIAKRGLVVMTYNIKFGGGRIDFFFDCHGKRVLMSTEEVKANLKGIAAKIRQLDPDVLFLQEVDINSKRSAFVDQLQWLLDHTSLNYGVYASQWQADFVPSDGLGAVNSGNAIVSKLPLGRSTRIALALRNEQSAIERYFYLQRNILKSSLVLENELRLQLFATHTAAYSQDGTKKKHLEELKSEMDKAAEDTLVLAGGDLNSLPPGSKQLRSFDDSACTDEYEADDYREERTWLDPFYDAYQPLIPINDYQANNAAYFTHTTSSEGFWNRKLDYLFTNASFAPGSGQVHQGQESDKTPSMTLSDHAPMTGILELFE